MKSAQISQYGDLSVLSINNSEAPAIESGEVLVNVYAASLNPVDSAILKGYMKDMIQLSFPATLGGDIAGVVTRIADDVTEFAVGDRVFGQSMAPKYSGAFAEYAVASVSRLAPMPNSLSFEEAASLPLAGASAFQALESMNVSQGEKVFINGGTGGIGSIAVQIARSLGAYVAITAGSQYADQARSLGANEIIDYRVNDFSDTLSGYDAVLDTAGADFPAMVKVLKDDGVVVSLTGSADETGGRALGVRASNQFTHVTREVLLELVKLVELGTLKPQVGAQFKFEDITEAFKLLEHGSVFGKIVISMKAY